MLPVSPHPAPTRPVAVGDDRSPVVREVHRRRSWRSAAVVPIVAIIALGTACQPAAQRPPESSAAATGGSGTGIAGTPAALPACVDAGPVVEPPAEFPSQFPLPPGTVLTSTRPTAGGGTYVAGYAPGTLQDVARFFVDELPKSGFTLGIGDSEPWEAESAFSGHGYEGHWVIATIGDCPGALHIAVATYRP